MELKKPKEDRNILNIELTLTKKYSYCKKLINNNTFFHSAI